MPSYKGNIITVTTISTAGTKNSAASGRWSLTDVLQLRANSAWPLAATVPGAPTIGTAEGASTTSISVPFTAPDTGGLSITSYTVTSSGGQTATGSSSPIVVTGLTNGTSYTFTVTATNALGTSVSSGTSNSVTPTVTDPYFSYVSLLLNGDGADGSTTFTDLSSTPKTVTAYGDAKISTAVKKYGTGAIAFDGSGDYLTIPYNSAFDFGTGDFTVEAWVNGPYASDTFIFSSSTNNGFFFGFTGLTVGIGRASVAWDTNYAHGATTNTWNHFAVSRYNSTTYVFVNGVLKGSATNSQNYSAQNSIMYVGTQGAMYITGYVDDLRITKGIARYTANFTPPTAAPTVIAAPSSVALLLTGNNLLDSSNQNVTVTNNGAVVTTSKQKYGTGSIQLAYNTGVTVDNTVFNFGTATDFTIEFWVYLNSRTLYSTICGQWGSVTKFNMMLNTSSSGNMIGIQYVPAAGGSDVFASSGFDSSYLPLSQWNHVAFSRSGSTCRCFVNGVGATLSSNPNIAPTGAVGVGNVSNQFYYGIDGYIADFRVTNGIARYTSNFTPPTSALTV